MSLSPSSSPDYLVARIRTVLATDSRVNKQDVRVAIRGDCVHLMGQASTEERQRLVGEIVAALLPQMRVCNELTLIRIEEAGQPERLS